MQLNLFSLQTEVSQVVSYLLRSRSMYLNRYWPDPLENTCQAMFGGN